ncbi:MAG: hypothetical protein RLZZ461_840, partial [Planctomycetota bacterium]
MLRTSLRSLRLLPAVVALAATGLAQAHDNDPKSKPL